MKQKNNSVQDRIFKVGHPSALFYPSHQSEFKDLFRFLGNCPPAPHLATFNTYFSLREKFRLQVGSCPRVYLEWPFFLACSKRSDSGERCEVKKAMKSRGRPGREVSYIFSRSFLLRTAPHYLNASNRLPFFGNPNLCGTEEYFK